MCQECGCSLPGHASDPKIAVIHANPQLNEPRTIEVIQNILHKNDHQAAHIRAHFDEYGVLGVNLMSSPGAGKTALLEQVAQLHPFRFAVIEGDLQTNKDAERLQRLGVDAYQITTGTACHLDAFMVHDALHAIKLEGLDVCFVENVGNLVCPASYDVGTHLNVVLLSVPEGSDKVAKYPVMFKCAQLVIITKTDLLPYFDFDIAAVKRDARALNPSVDIIELSTKDVASVQRFCDYLRFKKSFKG